MLDTLRILFITADSSLYGANRSLLNLISSLKIKKDNYLIITPKYAGLNVELNKLEIRNTVIEFRWECGYHNNNLYSKIKFFVRYIQKEWINLKAKRLIADVVKKGGFNIIHSNSSVISIGFEVAKKMNIRHVWHIREFIKLDFDLTLFIGQEQYYKKIYRSDAVICVSNSIAIHYEINGNGTIIYNAVAKKSEVTAPVKKEDYFLFCGAITKNKGLHKALAAFAEICEVNKKVILRVAGSFVRQNEYYYHILSLVEKLKLGNRVEFLGYRNDIKILMGKAAGLLVCSSSEGMGRVTAEAMLFGCVVIGYNDKAGTSELITHNKTGLIYNTKEEFISAMQYVLAEEKHTAAIIKQAREYAINNFTEEIYRNKIIDIYEKLI